MTGSFIQSHWPCRTLCPISMFSRILATEMVAVPRIHVGQNDAASSSMRPIRPSRRCSSMIERMYLASRSPRSSLTNSWSSSNSRPSSSSCSALSLYRGFSGSASLTMVPLSEFDLDGPFGGVDAGADRLALVAVDLARPQVADVAFAQRPDAGVADPLPASERQLEAGLLARH